MVGEFMGRDLRTESRGETGSFPLGRVLFPIDEGHTQIGQPTQARHKEKATRSPRWMPSVGFEVKEGQLLSEVF